jgi:hypothetical protein
MFKNILLEWSTQSFKNTFSTNGVLLIGKQNDGKKLLGVPPILLNITKGL